MRGRRTGLHEAVVEPSLPRLLPDLAGKRVVDRGCGDGWLCRYAVERGAASAVGVDGSARMLELARARTSDARVEYVRADLEDVDLPARSYELVASVLALHYLLDLEPLVRRAAAWLVPGGAFVAIVEHPMTTAQLPKRGWLVEDGRHVAWPVDHYTDEGPRAETWFVDGVVKVHRTVSTILGAFLSAGLLIDRVDEPRPPEAVLAAHPEHRDELIRPSLLAVRAVRGLGAADATE
jgi:SAM-dependent methyltransferase